MQLSSVELGFFCVLLIFKVGKKDEAIVKTDKNVLKSNNKIKHVLLDKNRDKDFVFCNLLIKMMLQKSTIEISSTETEGSNLQL